MSGGSWIEVRCVRCNRLLFKLVQPGGSSVEVKCPSCGKIQRIDLDIALTRTAATGYCSKR